MFRPTTNLILIFIGSIYNNHGGRDDNLSNLEGCYNEQELISRYTWETGFLFIYITDLILIVYTSRYMVWPLTLMPSLGIFNW